MSGERLHTLAWLCWLLAAATLALLGRQPLPQLLLCLAVAGVFTACAPPSEVRQGWLAFIRLGMVVWLVATVFNTFSVHAGRVVLFTLPRHWPIIGGPITLEALLYGVASGASLFAVLLVFAAFNAVVDSHRLLRWVPAGLFGAGLIISIGVTFVPHLVGSWREIRDAQRVRGHRLRGVRSLLPLVVPLLTLALERSFTLAESMEARGFGGVFAPAGGGARVAVPLLTVAGLLVALVGLVVRSFWPGQPVLGWGGLAVGLGAVGLALAWQGRQVRRSRYHRELWSRADSAVAAASLGALGLTFWARLASPLSLLYYPYPPGSPWPTFDSWVGLAASLLAAPAVVALLQAPARGEVQT